MNAPVAISVTQPPSRNLITVVMIRMPPVTIVPIEAMMSGDASAQLAALASQCRTMPSWVRVKVRNTLIEYMTTEQPYRAQRDHEDTTAAATAMLITPF